MFSFTTLPFFFVTSFYLLQPCTPGSLSSASLLPRLVSPTGWGWISFILPRNHIYLYTTFIQLPPNRPDVSTTQNSSFPLPRTNHHSHYSLYNHSPTWHLALLLDYLTCEDRTSRLSRNGPEERRFQPSFPVCDGRDSISNYVTTDHFQNLTYPLLIIIISRCNFTLCGRWSFQQWLHGVGWTKMRDIIRYET